MIGNLGFPEILLILLVVLLLFGAKRIPEIAGSMGKGIREFKRNLNEATREVSDTTSYRDQSIGPGAPGSEDKQAVDRDREPKRLIQ
jgi:sec-independent protein translocase protein TatA